MAGSPGSGSRPTGPRPPGRPKGSRTRDPADRRRELVEAAVAAVRRCGAEASMEQIAQEAGITKAVLYDHFTGKDGLRQAVVETYGDELLATLGSGVRAERSPAELLYASVAAFAAFVERDTALFRFVTHGEQTLLTEASPVFAELIRNTIEAAGGDSSGAEVYADVALGGVFAAVDAWVRTPTRSRRDLVDHVTTLLWRGLAAQAEGASDEPVDMAPAVVALAELGALPDDQRPAPD